MWVSVSLGTCAWASKGWKDGRARGWWALTTCPQALCAVNRVSILLVAVILVAFTLRPWTNGLALARQHVRLASTAFSDKRHSELPSQAVDAALWPVAERGCDATARLPGIRAWEP